MYLDVVIENFRTRHSSVGNCFAFSSSAALEKFSRFPFIYCFFSLKPFIQILPSDSKKACGNLARHFRPNAILQSALPDVSLYLLVLLEQYSLALSLSSRSDPLFIYPLY
jgi:hypothetical protein